MKHFFALPAIIRPAIYLAAASKHAFSVQDDLLAFPQYDVHFSDDYVTVPFAEARTGDLHSDGEVEPYRDQGEQFTDLDGDDGNDEQKYEYETLRLDGFRYLCQIPIVAKGSDAEQQGNETASKAEEELELARASDRGWELLAEMQGKCVYYISGWWSYRFCYGQGVKQFHQLPPSRGVPAYPPVEDPGVEGYELGFVGVRKVEEDDEPAAVEQQYGQEVGSALDASEGVKRRMGLVKGSGELVQRGESRYLVQRLEGGTKCDLTGKDRRIEVQYHCNPQSAERISLIKEVATCAYLMVIQTPRLCDDVAFMPPQKDAPNPISCQPILAEHEIESYEREMKVINAATHEQKIWDAPADATSILTGGQHDLLPLDLVGDIVIGGYERLPTGHKLTKSKIVGGGKETLVDTVASSAGKTLTDEDLQKMGLGDTKAIKELRKELEKIAQGQNWKLNVVDTPHGREYHGIIGDEDEGEDGQGDDGQGSVGDGKTKGKGKSGDGKKKKQETEDGSEEEYFKEEL